MQRKDERERERERERDRDRESESEIPKNYRTLINNKLKGPRNWTAGRRCLWQCMCKESSQKSPSAFGSGMWGLGGY